LLEQHRIPVIRFVYRMVEDQAVAEALAEEVFRGAYRSWATSALPSGFATWLFRKAIWLARAPLGEGRASERQSLRPGSPEILVRRAMAALPANQRAAVLLHKYERFDHSQIASILECSDRAVKLLLLQAYQSLRTQLMNSSPELRQPILRQGVAQPLPTRI
jgi:RNA polymerase sigma-70 factor (ECF subfamily)